MNMLDESIMVLLNNGNVVTVGQLVGLLRTEKRHKLVRAEYVSRALRRLAKQAKIASHKSNNVLYWRVLDDELDALFQAMHKHGDESGTDYEVGDLQALLRAAWNKLHPTDRQKLAAECRETLVDWLS